MTGQVPVCGWRGPAGRAAGVKPPPGLAGVPFPAAPTGAGTGDNEARLSG